MAQLLVTLMSFFMCVAIFFSSGPPSMGDEYRCVIAQRCTPDIEAKIFYSFAVLFAGATFPVLVGILSVVRRLDVNSERLKENHDALMAMASHSILVINSSKFEEFYNRALDKIRSTETSADIIATSSFTPPDTRMRDKYFSGLANIIISHNARYRVLLAKGNEDEWNKHCIEELEAREDHLNRAQRSLGEAATQWEYGNQFEARRSRFHARIDFLVVSDSIFMNISLSKDFNGARGFIYIKDVNAAEVFKNWFEVIWRSDNMSDRVSYNPHPAPGKSKFELN